MREGTQVAWREYHKQHNKVNILTKSNKNKYYTSRLNINNNDNDDTDVNEYDNYYIYSDKKIWLTTKTLTNTQKQIPPRLITHNNNIITKVKEITNTALTTSLTKLN